MLFYTRDFMINKKIYICLMLSLLYFQQSFSKEVKNEDGIYEDYEEFMKAIMGRHKKNQANNKKDKINDNYIAKKEEYEYKLQKQIEELSEDIKKIIEQSLNEEEMPSYDDYKIKKED